MRIINLNGAKKLWWVIGLKSILRIAYSNHKNQGLLNMLTTNYLCIFQIEEDTGQIEHNYHYQEDEHHKYEL